MSTTPTEPSTAGPFHSTAGPFNPPAPANAPAPTASGYETLKPSAQATPEAPAAPEPDWKAESRKWEQRAKENKAAAERLAEIEEASKTEAQKQAERTAELEAKVKEYETREQIAAWKAEVSKETGVPAVALAGSTKEEIEAHAATLKPLIGQATPTTDPPPAVVPTVGKTPGTTPNIPIGEQIAAAEREGNADLVAQLKAMQLASALK